MEALILDQFTTTQKKLKVEGEDYGRFTRYDYYLMLGPGNRRSPYDVFMQDFFESLQSLQ